MKTNMRSDWARIPATDAQRSVFNRSHGLKTTFDSGYLVPVEIQEVLPSDTVDITATLFGRLPPTVTPVMDNVFLDLHWFFCPSRLLWNNFTKMMGERVSPNDSIDYLVPKVELPLNGTMLGTVADYFGIPIGQIGGNKTIKVNSLPFRMYAKVWDEWYRDENLQDSLIKQTDQLGDSTTGDIAFNTLLKRNKRHDYFTSCLPWPQKGQSIDVPIIGGTAPVSGSSTLVTPYGSLPSSNVQMLMNKSDQSDLIPVGASDDYNFHIHASGKEGKQFRAQAMPFTLEDGSSSMWADLTNVGMATIASLRLAFQLQRLLERDARGGTRYCELLVSQFNTICPDARLQRSEYLGGSTTQIHFTPIGQTAATSDSSPQGNLAANGTVLARSRIHKSFTEHGYLMCLASVRCDLSYQENLDKMWTREGRYDFFWPVLQNVGEQAVLNKEIHCTGNPTVDDAVFGYQERYGEYKYGLNKITGKMRSNAAGTLDIWHLAQKFANTPALSSEFIKESPPLKRILAVADEPEFILDCYFDSKWTRPMGAYSIPGLVDHF